MKRSLALFPALFALLFLLSCSSGLEEARTKVTATGEAEVKTEEAKKEPAYSVKTPLTWEKINAIPIATSDMTTDQLRQICVEYFRLQTSFAWTPNKSFSYIITASNSERKFQPGKAYGGIPYFTSSKGGGNLYLWMEYYDEETGVLDVSQMSGQDLMGILGNHCAHGAFWGWGRVVNSAEIRGTKTLTQKNGCLNVGPYTYDPEIEEWSTEDPEKGTDKVCEQNGEQVMYQSYAQMLPADGVGATHIKNWHVRMVSSVPDVAYNADGTINGDESYVLMIEQASSVHDITAEDGEVLSIMSRVDHKYTFSQLFESGYIPFTFAEFLGTDPVEKAEPAIDLVSDTVTAEELRDATVTSNYSISNITVQAVNEDGEELYSYIGKFNPSDTGGNAIICESLPLAKYIFPASLNSFANREDVTIRILCRVSTGENLTVFEGKLIK